MLTIQQLNNLRDASTHAFKCEVATGIPSEMTLAQWALESAWGAHAPGNNCFGIKANPLSHQGVQLLRTREYFTTKEKDEWLIGLQGRTAELEDATFNKHGQQRYVCQDWFATFPSLAHCFIKRADLFKTPRYLEYFTKFKHDANLVSFVQHIAPIYATDPDYAQKVLQIASMPEVRSAVKEARAMVNGL